jgi:hypothetical protein
MKRTNLQRRGIKEGGEFQVRGTENIFNKIVGENFTSLKKEIPLGTQTLNIKNKERMLKTAREKDQVTYKGRPIRITPDFSMEILKVRRAQTDVLPTLRDHRCQSILLYPTKLLITIDREKDIL